MNDNSTRPPAGEPTSEYPMGDVLFPPGRIPANTPADAMEAVRPIVEAVGHLRPEQASKAIRMALVQIGHPDLLVDPEGLRFATVRTPETHGYNGIPESPESRFNSK